MSIKTASQLCIKTCDFRQRPLIFVRRDVNYCNAVAIPLPSLGVSSLDLGRLPTRAAFFLGGQRLIPKSGNRFLAGACARAGQRPDPSAKLALASEGRSEKIMRKQA